MTYVVDSAEFEVRWSTMLFDVSVISVSRVQAAETITERS
jgi:hypothetical protein